MHPDDVDADENGPTDTPADLGLNPLFGVTEDEDEVDNAEPPEPPGLDGWPIKPDTGFSSGH